MIRDIQEYESAYLADYGFEAVQVRYRRQLLLERLATYEPRIVVEVGCGDELISTEYARMGGRVDGWLIVEPAKRFAQQARAASDVLPGLTVIEGFFEESAEHVRASLPREPYVIICSGLLHEVADAQRLLKSIATVMGKLTVLHANVPNAASFHRRLARAMALVTDLKSLSQRNQELQQQRVYDAASLNAELAEAGYSVIAQGGYFVKPFTHAQMERVTPELGERVLDGLYELGKESPEWASEIFAEARRARP